MFHKINAVDGKPKRAHFPTELGNTTESPLVRFQVDELRADMTGEPDWVPVNGIFSNEPDSSYRCANSCATMMKLTGSSHIVRQNRSTCVPESP